MEKEAQRRENKYQTLQHQFVQLQSEVHQERQEWLAKGLSAVSEALAATDIISAPTVCHRRQQTQSEVTTSAGADEAASERQTYASTSFNIPRMMLWSSDEDIVTFECNEDVRSGFRHRKLSLLPCCNEITDAITDACLTSTSDSKGVITSAIFSNASRDSRQLLTFELQRDSGGKGMIPPTLRGATARGPDTPKSHNTHRKGHCLHLSTIKLFQNVYSVFLCCMHAPRL